MKSYNLLIFILLMFTTLLNQTVLAKVLVHHPEVTEQEFQNYLAVNADFQTFVDSYLQNSNYLNQELMDLFDSYLEEKELTKKEQHYTQLLSNIGSSPLNQVNKNLLVKLFCFHSNSQTRLKGDEFNGRQNESESYFNISNCNSEQVKSLQNRDYLFADSALDKNLLNQISIEPGDRLFINGWDIQPSEYNKISFRPNLYYHISIVSNSKYPINFLGEIKNFKYEKLLFTNSSCENFPIRNISKYEFKDLFGLFPQHCLGMGDNKLNLIPQQNTIVKSFPDSDFTEKGKQNNTPTSSDEQKSENILKKPLFWGAVAAGSIVLILASSNFLKNYEVSFAF